MILIIAVTPSLPAFRFLILNSMQFHMLVQLPLLVLSGYLINKNLVNNHRSLYEYTGLWIWVLLSIMFWMLPISMDKAVQSGYWDIFKLLSLIFSGYVLKPALSASKILIFFFIGSIVMMLFFAGSFYQTAESRLCSSYLIESQQTTGLGLLLLGFLILALYGSSLMQTGSMHKLDVYLIGGYLKNVLKGNENEK